MGSDAKGSPDRGAAREADTRAGAGGSGGTDPDVSEDYYFTDEGLMVFTEAYHLKRGSCCGSGCRHCPYENQ